MKIYVAGASNEMDWRAKPVIAKLRELGHEITYDWTKNVDDFLANRLKETREECAQNNYSGVLKADILVLLSPQHHSTGAWVEFGLALALRTPVYIAGNCDACIFSFLEFDEIIKFRTDEELLKYIEYNPDEIHETINATIP